MEESVMIYAFNERLDDEKYFSIRSCQNERKYVIGSSYQLHLFDDTVLYAIILCQDDEKIQAFDINRESACILTEKGNVYLVNIGRRKKKKKKKSSKDGKASKEILQGFSTSEVENNEKHKSIILTENELILNASSLQQGCDMVYKPDSLFFLLSSPKGLTVEVYQKQAPVNSCAKETFAFIRGCSYPDESKTAHMNLKQFGLLTPAQRRAKFHPGLLFKLCYKEGSSGCDPSIELVLSQALFQKLFGTELFLLGSPLVLIGTVDGRIISESLHIQEPHQSRSRVIFDIQQTVVGIYGLHVKDDVFTTGHASVSAAESSSNVLLLVGGLGALVVIYVAGESLRYEEFQIEAPVFTSCVCNDFLLHSTVADLMLTQFTYNTEMRTTETEANKGISMTSRRLGFYNATQLLAFNCNEYSQGTSAAALPNGHVIDVMAMTSQDKLYSLKINPLLPASDSKSNMTNEGLALKDLLKTITNIEKHTESLRAIMVDQNTALAQMSLCCHLLTYYLRHKTEDDYDYGHDPCPVQFFAKIECRDLGVEQEYTFVLTVKNCSQSSNIDGTCLSIYLSDHPNEMAGSTQYNQGEVMARAKCVKLANLAQGQSQDILLRLSTLEINNSLPLRVSVHLSLYIPQFNLSNATSEFPTDFATRTEATVLTDSKKPITVPVYCRQFDAVDLLRINPKPKAKLVSGDDVTTPKLVSAIKSIARQRPCFPDHNVDERYTEQSKVLKENVSSSLLVVKEMLQRLLGKSYRKAVRTGNDKELAVLVLNTLLTGRRQKQGDSVIVDANRTLTEPCAKCLTTRNHQALITLSPVKRNDSSTGCSGFLLQIQASCAADLVDIHRAFLRRLQVAENKSDASVSHLRSCLRQIQGLSSEIEALYLQSVHLSDAQRNRKTLQLYSALRNIIIP